MGDADIALRQLARHHPEALLEALDMKGTVEILGWLDTQVTSLERRLDKVLALRVDEERRALHVEFEHTLRAGFGRRIHEYQALFTMAHAAAEMVPPIASLVIVLTGKRDDAHAATAEHRTGWRSHEWSGVRYRVDAVYQRTVAELRARRSLLWLVFVPLVRDATLEAVGDVAKQMRAQATERDELIDLYVALLVMAKLDPWGHNLYEEINAMLHREAAEDFDYTTPIIRDAFDKGGEKGRLELADQMLRRLFVRRLGRTLTDPEQQALAARARAGDPGDVQDRALSLEGDALVAWLLDPSAK